MIIKVERVISWYNKDRGRLSGEYRIDKLISFQNLKKIFTTYQDDPQMYMVYDIEVSQANELKEYISFDFDFDLFKYQLDCYQEGT